MTNRNLLAQGIFSGGNDDGFAYSGYAQADNPTLAIYTGGNDDGFSTSAYAQADNPTLAIYTGGNDDGFSMSGYAQIDNPTLAIYVGGSGDGFSFSGVGGVGTEVPLPIELLNFSAFVKNNWVLLDWSTASEMDNDYFTIEKSKNARDWNELTTIEGVGNSSTLLNYSTIDKSPFVGLSYYRLKQTDFDGAFTYSQILSINFEDEAILKILIYPNPTNSQINIQGHNTETEAIRIYSTLGQDMTVLTKIIDQSENKKVIDLSKLSPGIYLVKTRTTVNKIYKNR